MLGHRLRRWPNIESTLGQCFEMAPKKLKNIALTEQSQLRELLSLVLRQNPMMYMIAGPALNQRCVIGLFLL